MTPAAAALDAIPFEHTYAALPERFRQAVPPTPVAAPRLLALNDALAAELGLAGVLRAGEPDVATVFGGNRVPAGARPIAMAYAGHQFGGFVPQLGDGRAILLGEVIDVHGRRRDVQLKGAGPTAFSRRGDGRAGLGPVLREFLMGEAMHALGVPTTRALAAVATGEVVLRDPPAPGAVLVRVAASHVRVGTFEYFAARGDVEGVRTLADHVIARHYPGLAARDDRHLALLDAIAARQASLVAAWMNVGFVHGVMNTDNMAVSGETIDYGPCAFLDEYHPGKTFSSIDRHGRYAFSNQAAIAQWNLARLAECLLPLVDAATGAPKDPQEPASEAAMDAVVAVLEAFPARFEEAWLAGMRRKLGLVDEHGDDTALVDDLLLAMQSAQADWTLTFRRLREAAAAENGRDALPEDPVAPAGFLDAWSERWRARRADDLRPPADVAAAMRAVNPAVIPRNHRVEQALAAAVEGDLAPFGALLDAVRAPFAEGEGARAYAARTF